MDQMRIGVMRGETVDELTRRIRPRMDMRSMDPSLRPLERACRRDAEALVRTATLTTCRQAHLDVFEANADVISAVSWLSTLDTRTTPLCRSLDDLEWAIPGYAPKGHDRPFPGTSPHWNCRSVVLPITKTWEEPAREAGGDTERGRELDELYRIPNSQRASMGGPVESMTYAEWEAERGKDADKLFNVDKEAFSKWFNDPQGNFVIDGLPPHIKEALGTQADSLIFSADTLAKQKEHHWKISPEEYVKVLNKINDRNVEMYRDGECKIALLIKDEAWYRTILKATHDRMEVYMVSLHKINQDHSLIQARKRPRITL